MDRSAKGLLLSFSLAIFVCFVANNLHPRFEHRNETISQQLAIWRGDSYQMRGEIYYFPEFQNRILFPAMLTAAQRLAPEQVGRSFLLLRLLTAFLAFLAFYYLCIDTGLSSGPAMTAAGLLAYSLIFTFNHAWEVPSDFPDAMFTALFVWATVKNYRWTLLVLALLASTNRESAVFAGVIWFFVRGLDSSLSAKERYIEAAYSFGVSAAAYASVVLLRLTFGGQKAIGQSVTFASSLVTNLQEALQSPSPSSWPLLLLAIAIPYALWLRSNKITDWTKRLLYAGIFIACVSLLFGIVSEPRIFIPSMVILAHCAAVSGSHDTGRPANSLSPS